MKIKSILSLLIGTAFTGQVFAQSSIDTKYWSLLSLKYDTGFQDITNKYDGYLASSILFDKNNVEINLYQEPSCATGMLCTQNSSAVMTVIKLQVRKIISSGCYESYYASTPDNIKSSIYEQVIVNRFTSEREHCTILNNLRDGYIHFKATGLSKSTGEQVSAHAYATLVNVKVLNEIRPPAPPPLPKQ